MLIGSCIGPDGAKRSRSLHGNVFINIPVVDIAARTMTEGLEMGVPFAAAGQAAVVLNDETQWQALRFATNTSYNALSHRRNDYEVSRDSTQIVSSYF